MTAHLCLAEHRLRNTGFHLWPYGHRLQVSNLTDLVWNFNNQQKYKGTIYLGRKIIIQFFHWNFANVTAFVLSAIFCLNLKKNAVAIKKSKLFFKDFALTPKNLQSHKSNCVFISSYKYSLIICIKRQMQN